MKRILFLIAGCVFVAALFLVLRQPAEGPEFERFFLETPQEGDMITSPLTIRGYAHPDWFAEGNLPVFLTNWDGLIIAEMEIRPLTSENSNGVVPFEAELIFEKPDFNNRGSFIIQRANPSRNPDLAEAHEITVFFQ